MTQFHINSDDEPSPETVELLSKVADQIHRRYRPHSEYRWWRVWTNLREYPPDKIGMVGFLIGATTFVYLLWAGEVRLW